MGMTTGWFEKYLHHVSTKQASQKDRQASEQSWLVALPSHIWEFLTKRLASTSEPQFWQKRDRYGKLSWWLYDPSTNQSAVFASEAEARIWLEERYYH